MKRKPKSPDNTPKLVTIQPNLASPAPELREAAFKELVKTNRAPWQNMLRARFPSLAEHLVEEAVQDTCLMLWADLQNPGWEEKWTSRFFRFTAYRECRKHLRLFLRAKGRFGHHMGKVFKTPESEAAVFGTVGLPIEEREGYAEYRRIFEGMVKAMPIQQQRVANLLLENPCSVLGPTKLIKLYHEAYRIKLTPGAAKSALAVVRNKMRQVIASADAKTKDWLERIIGRGTRRKRRGEK
jgi:DNA-directed RNA polymerase specialized sigma24 family protein